MAVISTFKSYSKAVAGGNHVVWTRRQPIPLSGFLAGLPTDGAVFSGFRVPPGDGLYCLGFSVSFQVPGGSQQTPWSILLCAGDGTPVPNAVLPLSGISLGGEFNFKNPLPLPPNSLWLLACQVPDMEPELVKYLPESVSSIIWLRYAAGPVTAPFYATSVSTFGINFDSIGTTLQVS